MRQTTLYVKRVATRYLAKRLAIAAAERSVNGRPSVEDRAIDRLLNGTLAGLVPAAAMADGEDAERWDGLA